MPSPNSAALDELRRRIAAIESSDLSSQDEVKDNVAEVKDNVAEVKDNVAVEKPKTAEEAFRKIERILNRSEQASALLLQRLARDGFPEEAAREAVERAVRCGLVDDLRYGDVLVRSRLAQGKGLPGIAAELSRAGIDPDEVEAFVEQSEERDHASEVERALQVLERKPPRSKNIREGAYRRLIQKGFGSSVAATAARLYSERDA